MRPSSPLLLLLVLLGCSSEPESPDPRFPGATLSASEQATLETATIFFGHQSVGRNLLEGMAEILPGLRVVHGVDGPLAGGPMLLESSLGRNGDPRSKDRAFLDVADHLRSGTVALYKYCYADMGADTDPDSLHAGYARTLARAADRGLRVVAVTMPLTTAGPPWKYWLERLLGRTTDRELNARRDRFNRLLRESSHPWPLVDLARFESTAPDGTRSVVSFRGGAVPVLSSEFTADGSHLDARGRRVVAARFLRDLARAIDSPAP